MASIIAYIVWRIVMATALVCLLAAAYKAYGDTPPHRSHAAQLMAGLVFVAVLYYLLLLVMHQDKLVRDPQVDIRLPKQTQVVDGYIETALIANTTFDTLDIRAPHFISLPRSYNRKGGAQFTYQFWIYLTEASSAANMTILLRGDPKSYNWNDATGLPQSGVAIACPSIGFGSTYSELVINFNTLDGIRNTYSTTPTNNAAPSNARQNMLSLILKKWALFTIVFEDNIPVSEYEDGIRMRLYLGDVMFDSVPYPGKTMRQNNGQLYLFPTGGIQGAKVGNLSYYNYALEGDAIKLINDRGPPTSRSTIQNAGTDVAGQPLFLSEYNKLDVYKA